MQHFTATTTSQALQELGLDFESKKGQVFDHMFQPISGKSTIYRADTDKVLGIHSSRYEHMSYSEAFEVFDRLLGDGQCQVVSGANIDEGARAFLQIKMPETAEVLRGDSMDLYLNGFASHDGSFSLAYSYGANRLACSNQVMGTFRQGRKQVRSVSIRHSKNMRDKMELAEKVLWEGAKCLEVLRENAQILARKAITSREAKQFADSLFPLAEGAKKDRNKANREKVIELVDSGMGTDIEGVRGSAWGLYNAGTEWYDHHSPTRGKGLGRDERSVVEGAKFRDRAFELAMAIS